MARNAPLSGSLVLRDAPQALPAPKPLVAHFRRGRSKRLVISFAGVGRQRNCAPPMEFVDVASNRGENHVLFISDPTRSWMNGAGLDSKIVGLIEEYRSRFEITQVIALGNSMGGFSAIRLAELISGRTVIAFAPQFSADPAMVPEEDRWMFFRRKITHWPHRQVGNLAQPDTMYFLFHGNTQDEVVHWSRFAWNRRLHHFIIVGEGHSVAKRLRQRRFLQNVVNAAIEQRPRRVRRLLERAFSDDEHCVLRREHFEQGVQYPTKTAARSKVEVTGSESIRTRDPMRPAAQGQSDASPSSGPAGAM